MRDSDSSNWGTDTNETILYPMAHSYRVHFLDTLAALMGCQVILEGGFPNRRYPDVLRIDFSHSILFIGDAKNSESPSNRATQARLLEYLRWLSVYVARENTTGIFAICFGREADTDGWMQAVTLLGLEAGLSFAKHGMKLFEPGLIVVWFVS